MTSTSTTQGKETDLSRDRTQERQRALLQKSTWASSEALILQHFDQATLNSRRLIEALLVFSNRERNFEVALPLLQQARRQRQSGEIKKRGGWKTKPWSSMDVEEAMRMHNTTGTAAALRPVSTNNRRAPRNVKKGFKVFREDNEAIDENGNPTKIAKTNPSIRKPPSRNTHQSTAQRARPRNDTRRHDNPMDVDTDGEDDGNDAGDGEGGGDDDGDDDGEDDGASEDSYVPDDDGLGGGGAASEGHIDDGADAVVAQDINGGRHSAADDPIAGPSSMQPSITNTTGNTKYKDPQLQSWLSQYQQHIAMFHRTFQELSDKVVESESRTASLIDSEPQKRQEIELHQRSQWKAEQQLGIVERTKTTADGLAGFPDDDEEKRKLRDAMFSAILAYLESCKADVPKTKRVCAAAEVELKDLESKITGARQEEEQARTTALEWEAAQSVLWQKGRI